MSDVTYNSKFKIAVSQTLPLTTLAIVTLLLPIVGGNRLNQPAYAAGAIQPPSCEHPPVPPPTTPYPTTLSLTPINAPIFIPPSLTSGSGGAIQPRSCEHPPAPKPVVPYPPSLSQTPINSPSFPSPVPPVSQPPLPPGEPIQPPSCEHPPVPKPPVPYPPGLGQTPVNSPSFPPPVPPVAQPPLPPGEPVQPPSCEHPPLPEPPVAYPGGLNQVPINTPSFPCQPVKPYHHTCYGVVPYIGNPAIVVPGAGNIPGIGVPGNTAYGFPGTTTLRDPLVPGASFAFPGNIPPTGLLPPIGSGLTPNPVNPGMLGEPPTVVPWANGTAGNSQTYLTNQLVIPSNQIDQQSSTVSMPFTNAAAQAPGTWNSQGIRDIIPPSPSVPGADPGILRQPGFNAGTWAQGYTPAAVLAPLGNDGQLTGTAPTTRSQQRGQTHDFGLGQNTETPKTFFAYRMQVNGGQDGPPTFNGWKGLPGSTTQDFGVGVKQLAAQGQLGSQLPPQISYDSARQAEYPGGQSNTGNLNSNSLGNHGHNADPPFFAAAQVTNDLYGVPMVNPARTFTDGSGNSTSGIPLKTIAPY